MIIGIKRLMGVVVTILSCLPVLAQQPVATPTVQLPGHAVRSISPADTSWQDLEFLRQEIGAARVVMLGEPTHGEGSVTGAKIRLLRFLHAQLGFTTVAFESGFYELDKAQREIETGAAPVPEAIGNSVFNIWTGTQEFQAILLLVGRGRLRVAGFDPQLSGAYQDDMLDELEALLKPEKGADGIAYDYLDECFSMMGESFIFPPTNSLIIFDLQLKRARQLLEKVAAGPNARRRERAGFWLQNLRSLQALAHDYATHDPTVKDSAAFKAVDSNPRDAQMADNLLWYLRQHPQEKVVCWGALPHFANKVEVLHNAELRAYRPMGRAVKAALGEEAVYILGTLAGGGTHGFPGQYRTVPAPAPGTLEADLLAQPAAYSFVSLKHEAAGQPLTTYAFDYTPLTGAWSEIVDGFLFLSTVEPPHPAILSDVATAPDSAALAPPVAGPAYLNPAARTLGKARATAATSLLRGTVLDDKTGQPVPFATVALPAHATGTVADGDGHFALAVRRGDVVQVSSLGYAAKVLTAAGEKTVAVRLVPSAYALGDVRVSGESLDARKIMRKVIKAIPQNYEQRDYAQQVYTRRRAINFDTLRHDVEYTSRLWTPAGYHNWAGGFLALESTPVEYVQEKNVLTQVAPVAPAAALDEGGHGFAGGFDPVRISPLFKSGTLGRYQLYLDTVEQHEGESWYVIRFAAKRASHRTTGMYLTAGYSGRVYVRQGDYAVVRYEALWQDDTVQNNAVARKYYGRNQQLTRLYDRVYDVSHNTHVVTYQRAADGRYYAAASIAQAAAVGRTLGKEPFYRQLTCEVYYAPPELVAKGEIPDPKLPGDAGGGGVRQIADVPYHPEFWQAYQRPVPTKPTPPLPAKVP